MFAWELRIFFRQSIKLKNKIFSFETTNDPYSTLHTDTHRHISVKPVAQCQNVNQIKINLICAKIYAILTFFSLYFRALLFSRQTVTWRQCGIPVRWFQLCVKFDCATNTFFLHEAFRKREPSIFIHINNKKWNIIFFVILIVWYDFDTFIWYVLLKRYKKIHLKIRWLFCSVLKRKM